MIICTALTNPKSLQCLRVDEFLTDDYCFICIIPFWTPFTIFLPYRGVFVRIKDKNLHVDCFKCSTCGTSLKNVGYYNINEKLYCDIHAKMVARQQAPSGLTPVTVPP